MIAAKTLTAAAYMRGDGTRKQRAQFEEAIAALIPRIGEHVTDSIEAANALAQATGAQIDGDEDLQMLIDRAKDDPRTVGVLALMGTIQALRRDTHDLQDAPRKAAAAHGTIGGKMAAVGNKKPNGLTHIMNRRKVRFEALKVLGVNDGKALDKIADEEGCSPEAVRQSLKSAGVPVSTKDRQGRRR